MISSRHATYGVYEGIVYPVDRTVPEIIHAVPFKPPRRPLFQRKDKPDPYALDRKRFEIYKLIRTEIIRKLPGSTFRGTFEVDYTLRLFDAHPGVERPITETRAFDRPGLNFHLEVFYGDIDIKLRPKKLNYEGKESQMETDMKVIARDGDVSIRLHDRSIRPPYSLHVRSQHGSIVILCPRSYRGSMRLISPHISFSSGVQNMVTPIEGWSDDRRQVLLGWFPDIVYEYGRDDMLLEAPTGRIRICYENELDDWRMPTRKDKGAFWKRAWRYLETLLNPELEDIY